MIRLFNRAAHFAIGVWAGWNYRNPASAVGSGLFVAYQALEQRAIHDGAFGEIREYAVGYAIGLTARWLRENAPKPPKKARNDWLGL